MGINPDISKNTSNFLLVELVTFDTGRAQTNGHVLMSSPKNAWKKSINIRHLDRILYIKFNLRILAENAKIVKIATLK